MPQRKPAKKTAKKPMPALYIRAPQSYHDDLEKISQITGLTKNAICLDILRHGIKGMLQDINKK